MSIEKWVAGAGDDEVIDMFNHGDARLVGATLSAVGLDQDRLIRTHQRIAPRLIDIMRSEEFKSYDAHEKMVPDAFKAEFQPADNPPEVGSLVNGSLLCIDNEDAAFPECLDSGKIRPIFNAKLKQYQWVPTAKEAVESSHYEITKREAYLLLCARQARQNRIEQGEV
jgi:hypothetical protein